VRGQRGRGFFPWQDSLREALPGDANRISAGEGFTLQGYIEICEDGGPNIYFIGLNSAAVPLTIRTSFRASFDMSVAPTRVTYADRNKKLGS
jgi:hypothetical protein